VNGRSSLFPLPRTSIEQRIFESKNTYYDRLYQSQRDWHQANHTI